MALADAEGLILGCSHSAPANGLLFIFMEVSRLNVLPSLGVSVLGSICEGNENGSECRLVNSLPVQGSLGFGATTGTLGIGRCSHDASPMRPEGTGGSLSLDGQSPGVQGKGRL